MSLSSHQSARMGNDEWLTPPEILAALGPFELDPCAPIKRPWPTAALHFTTRSDGLARAWGDRRVWLNPPFGQEAAKWIRKAALHGNAIALIPARTETAMFHDWVWGQADAVLFLRGRPHFHFVDGSRAPFNSGAPICLVAYGERNALVLREAIERGELAGFVVDAKGSPTTTTNTGAVAPAVGLPAA
ncbi:adenine methyltransferase [Burkholderia vietnamiensis]|uniref:Adenine methyltransferase n=1 Tax=Burkholderia vietnamiensis (strain G4 / LMG 22486) TaxID=269482 RepID=A4JFU8_BURVG|nr:hypothetical protein Bcep1808_2149 [Burkholderia vietnamiensis G4]MCB4344907.1 adenine methyltransferase [Burkholderia vietnamiensis]